MIERAELVFNSRPTRTGWTLEIKVRGIPEGMLDEYEELIAATTFGFLHRRGHLDSPDMEWGNRRTEQERKED